MIYIQDNKKYRKQTNTNTSGAKKFEKKIVFVYFTVNIKRSLNIITVCRRKWTTRAEKPFNNIDTSVIIKLFIILFHKLAEFFGMLPNNGVNKQAHKLKHQAD